VTAQALAPATTAQLAVARTAANSLGLYFKLADPYAIGSPRDWRPATLLYRPEAGPLDELLRSVQARLGGCEHRVAASLLYQGYAARLLSPQLACLVTAGRIPELPADRLSWREPATEIIELGLAAGPGWQGEPGLLLGQLIAQSFTAHLDPLAAAIQARTHISAAILQDNAASALISGLRLLAPRLEDGDWRPLASLALADRTLRGSGTLRTTEPGFVRRSCCLYYRTPAGGLCGDCPLA
jgi:ferric iron reductase protein FhuF